jgi:ABC-type sugar transport system ATPase subunit
MNTSTRLAGEASSLRLDGIRKSFGATVVVDRIDLDVEPGEFLVLVGGSGCGKSTLLRMVAGLETPTEGRIVLGGQDVTALAPRERDVAMVFQSYALYPHMTVAENLGFALHLRRMPADEIRTHVERAAGMLELDQLLHRRPGELSGGQRQRVAIGRAIVRHPRLFLFDEPLSNLDAALRAHVRVELRTLHAQLGVTTLYVTHDQVEAMTLGDRILLMAHGVVQQVGSPQELFHWPANRYTAGFIGSPSMNFLQATPGGPGVEAPDFTLPLVASLLQERRCPDRVEVGIRPHELRPGPAPADGGPWGTLQARVEFIEPLGWEAHVHLRVGQERLIARVEAGQLAALVPGAVTPWHVAASQCRLFDPTDGAALYHAPRGHRAA